MKFIHFSDAHLDSPFRGLSFLPQSQFSRIRRAAETSLSNICSLALQEKVDLVLIAGDTFDSNRPSPSSQLFFAKQIKRLENAGIQTIMIFGNHDHMERSRLFLEDSPFFKLLGNNEKVETQTFTSRSGFRYTVSGFSYLHNHIEQDKVSEFPSSTDSYSFGIMHGQEKMEAGKDVYAPFALAELQDLGYNYFALGHIHKRQVLSQQPLIAYSGNIQGRHIHELGAKGCYLGVVDENSGATKISFVPTAPITWSQKKLKLTETVSKADLNYKIKSLMTEKGCHFYCLIIEGAQFLDEEEQDLLSDHDYWTELSASLPGSSFLVDVRFTASEEKTSLNSQDLPIFNQAGKDIFTEKTFYSLAKDWINKDELSRTLAADSDFRKSVEELTKVKLGSKLREISNETDQN